MNKGFTLIEIMVAVSLFTIVAMITTGALVTISDVNRKAQAIKIAMDNVSFAMDSMILSLREGARFGCLISGDTDDPNSIFGSGSASTYLDEPCNSGGGIVFLSKRGNNAIPVYKIYRFKENGNGPGVGSIQIASSDSAQYKNLTSPEVNIVELSFYVPDVTNITLTAKTSTATIIARGEVPGKNPTKFNLQATVMPNF